MNAMVDAWTELWTCCWSPMCECGKAFLASTVYKTSYGGRFYESFLGCLRQYRVEDLISMIEAAAWNLYFDFNYLSSGSERAIWS